MKLPPGTVVTVGAHTATVEKFLAEGGLAHVHLARLTATGEICVLKSVTTNTAEGVRSMQNEVQYMRMFSGHKNIVRFIDAEFVAHQGQHTFILMEYCQGGHVVDLMNSRLHDRLKEREILKIFGDACEGVASMHYAKPPVIHRDIKVENLLVSNSDDYKLCDFGSATTQILPPRSPNFSVSKTQLDLIHEDVQKHTTLQYRAPELCDVYSGRGINEKVDIWALGVMLYKLCYYTTPFEKEGASTVTAIMSGRYNIPSDPPFSKDLIAMIQWCLLDQPAHRPTIYQLVHEICRLRGINCPLENIYPDAQPIPATVFLTQLANTMAVAQNPVPGGTAYGVQQQAPPSALRGPPPMPPLPAPLDPMRRGRPGRSPNIPGMPQQQQQQQQAPPINSSNGYGPNVTSSSPSPFAAFDSVGPAAQVPLPHLPPPSISTSSPYVQPPPPSMYQQQQQAPPPPIPPRSPAPIPQLQQAPMLSMSPPTPNPNYAASGGQQQPIVNAPYSSFSYTSPSSSSNAASSGLLSSMPSLSSAYGPLGGNASRSSTLSSGMPAGDAYVSNPGPSSTATSGPYGSQFTSPSPPSGLGLLSSQTGSTGVPFPASTAFASGLGARPKSASVSGLTSSGHVINGPQVFQGASNGTTTPTGGPSTRSSSARGSVIDMPQAALMNMSTPPTLPVQLPMSSTAAAPPHRRAPSLGGTSSPAAGMSATPPASLGYPRTVSPNPSMAATVTPASAAAAYYAGGSSGKSAPPPVARVHRADRFRVWLDRYFRHQVFKRKYLARLVTESWRLRLTAAPGGTPNAPPCMAYWLDRVAQIVPANGALATLRALLLVNWMLVHADAGMLVELVARRGDLARLADAWDRAKYAVIDEFAVVYARWLVSVLDFHARVAGLGVEGSFHVGGPVDRLGDAQRLHLAEETHRVIQQLEPYFVYLFERGQELSDKYPWEEVHDAVVLVLEAAYAAYMQHICLMRTLDRARDVRVRALAEGLQTTSTYIGHLSIASAKALVQARVEAEGYRVPKHRPSTDLNASWSQPPSMLPKVLRRLHARGIDAGWLQAHVSGKQPPACRPEYGSVYDAAQRDFVDSSDSD